MSRSKQNTNAPTPAIDGSATRPLPIESARDRYLDFVLGVKGVSGGRAMVCKINLNRLIRFLRGQRIIHIHEVTRELLNVYQAEVLRSELKPSTKHGVLRDAALWFAYLHDYRLIPANPGLAIDVPRRGQMLPRPILSEAEYRFLLGLASGQNLMQLRDRCVFQILYASAMRPGELCRLTRADVDLDRQQLLIRRPKNRRDRIVPIDRHTAQDLRQYLIRLEAWLGPRRPTDHFFVNTTGGRLDRNLLSSCFAKAYTPRLWEKFSKRVTLYCIRHTSATDWLDSGARRHRDVLPFVQRQLGHESLESTAIYTHVAIEPLRQMFKRYHPREKQYAYMGGIPGSPDDLEDRWGTQRKRPPPEPPPL